jgi:NiFe hydrogenase small subunit HydA
MAISRREFLKYCGISATAVGLDPLEIGLLKKVLANPAAPSVIWLQGSACVGCSISLLNRISDTAPATVTDVLVDSINLVYHPTLMSAAGETAVAALREVYENGNYILVVEGGVPTAFNGFACIAYSYDGKEVSFQEAVQEYAAHASHVVCVGTCASYGGIPASGLNPTEIVGVEDLISQTTVNIPGCPANPDWVVWAIVQLLLSNPVNLDAFGRPLDLFDVHGFIHDSCPRNQGGANEATDFGQDGKCLIRLGCRGPHTKAKCEKCWNGKEGQGSWCIGVNAQCHGCVEPAFPGPESFFEPYNL